MARRRPNPTRRSPGDRNDWVPCACGCEKNLRRFDAQGRERQFLPHHGLPPPPSPVRDAILSALAEGPQTRAALVKAAGTTEATVAVTLSELRRRGAAVPIARGVWANP